MQREVLLVAEIIDAAERIVSLTSGATVASLDGASPCWEKPRVTSTRT